MKQEAFASVAVEVSQREEICAILDVPYDPEQWNDWRWQMRHRLTRLDQFERLLDLTDAERRGLLLASEKFSVAITPHFAALIDPHDPSCPIRLQVVPQESELLVSRGDMTDPCGEDGSSVVEGLVHRYPDRVLLLALDTCASYCRYCTRSRLVSQGSSTAGASAVEETPAVVVQEEEVRRHLVVRQVEVRIAVAIHVRERRPQRLPVGARDSIARVAS